MNLELIKSKHFTVNGTNLIVDLKSPWALKTLIKVAIDLASKGLAPHDHNGSVVSKLGGAEAWVGGRETVITSVKLIDPVLTQKQKALIEEGKAHMVDGEFLIKEVVPETVGVAGGPVVPDGDFGAVDAVAEGAVNK